jgi:hypothetical protein
MQGYAIDQITTAVGFWLMLDSAPWASVEVKAVTHSVLEILGCITTEGLIDYRTK